jgi:hypothetical protein
LGQSVWTQFAWILQNCLRTNKQETTRNCSRSLEFHTSVVWKLESATTDTPRFSAWVYIVTYSTEVNKIQKLSLWYITVVLNFFWNFQKTAFTTNGWLPFFRASSWRSWNNQFSDSDFSQKKTRISDSLIMKFIKNRNHRLNNHSTLGSPYPWIVDNL